VLICRDGLDMLDEDWSSAGALGTPADWSLEEPASMEQRQKQVKEAGESFGAPDFSKRHFFRSVVNGRHELVRWFAPETQDNPRRGRPPRDGRRRPL
jgi:arylsulfatase